jgi:PAS domain-containing protein
MASLMLRHFPLWLGAVDAAKVHNVNLICFLGGPIPPSGRLRVRHFLPNEFHAALLYDLANVERLDGLVTWAGSGVGLGMHVGTEEMAQFLERYRTLPIINYEGDLAGIPSVVTDTYQGMRALLSHLIDVHACRRIVLMRGPQGHMETEARYRAYVDTMAAYGLPYNPALVCPPVGWGPEYGVEMTHLLLDERKLEPGVDFDAIAATEVEYAIGAVRALQARGVPVPYDVAVVGFNDRPEAQTASPSVTTMRKPFYASGYQALEAALDLIQGKPVPDRIEVPARLIMRRSCGCWPSNVTNANLDLLDSSGVFYERSPKDCLIREKAAGDVVSAIAESLAPLAPPSQCRTWATRLWDALLQTLWSPLAKDIEWAQTAFLPILEEALRETQVKDALAQWHATLTLMACSLMPRLVDAPDIGARAVMLWQQARILVEKEIQRTAVARWLKVTDRSRILLEISQEMMNASNVPQLTDALVRRLPELDIFRGYLALYENPQPRTYPWPAPPWSRLVLAFDRQGQVQLESHGQRFHSRHLVPKDLLPHDRVYTLMVMPLHFGRRQFGFMLLEVGPRDGPVYRALAQEVSSVLQSIMLLREQHQIELTLREHEEQMRTLIEFLPIGFWAKDADGRYIMQNSANRQLMGDNVGLTLEDIDVDEALRAEWCAQDERVLAGETIRSESAFRVKDQTRIYQQIVVPVWVEAQVVAMLGIMIDVTEQRALEVSLRRAIQTAEEARQTAEAASQAKSTFLANMSHELRTPLNAVLGFSELMFYDANLTRQQRENLDIIGRSGEHLLALINDVLDLSKIEAGKVDLRTEIFDLHEMLLGLGEMFSLQAELKGLTVVFDFEPSVPPYVRADVGKLRQVLINLLGNAVKFTEKGGGILRVSVKL